MSYALVTVPSTFPAARRPIYPYAIANVTHKNKDDAYPKLASALDLIAAKYPDSRILAHTVSYDLTRYLHLHSVAARVRGVAYSSAGDRDGAIKEYLARPNGILLACSLERGLDLPGDDCRAIIVCKIPYPNLGDKQVSARIHLYGGQLWYSVQTIRALVQMTGRGMRSADDSCDSYILDEQFASNIWRKNRGLLPAWWLEAVVTNPPKL